MKEINKKKTNKKNKGTFVLHIYDRKNATWQGEIVWAEEKDKVSFRSALEAIKIIEGALDSKASKYKERDSRGGNSDEEK